MKTDTIRRREPHKLEPTKTIRNPRRMIFFDSESKTSTVISDQEIKRAQDGEKVTKAHHPYLICAAYYQKRTRREPRQKEVDYHSESLGEHFLEVFWKDVDRFAKMNERLYIFAHNAKYDLPVTGGITALVKIGYKVIGFSDDNPFILHLEREVTHSPRTGKPYVRVNPDTGEKVPTPKKKRICILSSTNYFQQSLASLAKV